MDYPWGHKELDMTEQLSLALDCIIEGIFLTCSSIHIKVPTEELNGLGILKNP